MPKQPVISAIPPVPPQPVLQAAMVMIWSFFKPEFSGKPDKHPETHLLKIIDRSDKYNSAADERVGRFPLTLVGKVRLWYQSIYSFQGKLEEELEEMFRTQFSNIANKREQLLHATFHFNEMQRQLMPM